MKKHFLIFTISLLFFSLAQGKVKLPAMMGDHMVLQQNSSVKLWGWADGKKVTVTTSWNNRTYKVSTDDEGAWLVKVDTPAGSFTPYSITISDGIRVTLSDILIGEVWICSGQSNMEMTMKGNMGAGFPEAWLRCHASPVRDTGFRGGTFRTSWPPDLSSIAAICSMCIFRGSGEHR